MTGAAPSPYEILGISPDASPEEIRQAYHKGALKYHPDNSRHSPIEAEKQFRKLAKAYKIALRAHLPRFKAGDEARPISPSDFARMNTRWYANHAHIHGAGVNNRDQEPESRTVATVDENRVFVMAWSLATVLGMMIVLLSASFGLLGDVKNGLQLSDVLLIELMAMVVVAAVLAGAIYGITLTRKTIWLTVQLGIGLLPFLPRPRRRKQSSSPSPRNG